MGLEKYSLTNVTNSVAEYLASTLLTAGYLVYWPTLDAIQTPDGVYTGFQADQGSLWYDNPTAEGRLAASRGIVTLRNDDFSFPQFPVRPTSDGTVASFEDFQVPSVTLHLDHDVSGIPLGLGSRQRVRYLSLDLYGLARDYGEQLFLLETLRVAFDDATFVSIVDHDAGTRAAVGKVEVQRTDVGKFIYPLKADSRAFEVTLNARLRYEA